MVPFIDVILLIMLSGFIFYGFFFGLIRTFGNILGVVVGAILASRFYLYLFAFVHPIFLGYDNLGKVLCFVILFGILSKLVSLVFVILDKSYNLLSIIPFLKTINRLAGAFFGFILGSLILGVIFYVASKYAFIDTWFGRFITESMLVPFFVGVAKVLMPVLPEMLKKIQGLI